MSQLQSARESCHTTTLFDVGPLLDIIAAYTVPTNELIARHTTRVLDEWDDNIQRAEAAAQQKASK
jgi:hypothetical protein